MHYLKSTQRSTFKFCTHDLHNMPMVQVIFRCILVHVGLQKGLTTFKLCVNVHNLVSTYILAIPPMFLQKIYWLFYWFCFCFGHVSPYNEVYLPKWIKKKDESIKRTPSYVHYTIRHSKLGWPFAECTPCPMLWHLQYVLCNVWRLQKWCYPSLYVSFKF